MCGVATKAVAFEGALSPGAEARVWVAPNCVSILEAIELRSRP